MVIQLHKPLSQFWAAEQRFHLSCDMAKVMLTPLYISDFGAASRGNSLKAKRGGGDSLGSAKVHGLMEAKTNCHIWPQLCPCFAGSQSGSLYSKGILFLLKLTKNPRRVFAQRCLLADAHRTTVSANEMQICRLHLLLEIRHAYGSGCLLRWGRALCTESI